MHTSWKEILLEEFSKTYYLKLENMINDSYQEGNVYPPQDKIFRALQLPFSEVKVLILGQDPYHGPGQANGLAFAINQGMPLPGSLKNIFKEVKKEFGISPDNSDLTGWADQGVLLLNSILTVKSASPASHQKWGWQNFTDAIISSLSKREEPLAFMLWGAYAKGKVELIDGSKHLILETSHPSPLSVYQGFSGCNHFKLANDWLEKNKKEPICWFKS